MHVPKFYPIVLVLSIASCSISYTQTPDSVKIIQSLETYKDSIQQGSFNLIPTYRKNFRQLPEQSQKSRKIDLVSFRFNRNAELNLLYAENSKITSISYVRMDVDSVGSNVLDADINLSFLALPKIWRFGVLVNPHFNMRMFLDQESKPIRTPSNMIGLTGYMHLSPGFNKLYQFVSLSFYHHSNGQVAGSYNSDGSLNIKTGNFAVNYSDVSYMIGYLYAGKVGERKLAGNLYGKIGYQKDYIIHENDNDINPITGKPALEDEYGQNRINFEVSNTFYVSKKEKGASGSRKHLREESSMEESFFHYFRFMLEGSYIFVNGKNEINAEFKAYWKIPYSPNFLLTLQTGWLGHDYYNIYFTQQTWVFRAGIAAALIAGPGSKRAKIEEKYRKLVTAAK